MLNHFMLVGKYKGIENNRIAIAVKENKFVNGRFVSSDTIIKVDCGDLLKKIGDVFFENVPKECTIASSGSIECYSNGIMRLNAERVVFL